MSEPIKFFVPGIPATAGSKRAFRTPSGKIIVTPANKKTAPWMDSVRWNAMKAFEHQIKLEGTIRLDVTFVMPRPNSHFRTGRYKGEMKSNAPYYHDKKPDRTKLLRAVEDAITGIIWRDDAQVATGMTEKIYGDIPGAHITIHAIENTSSLKPDKKELLFLESVYNHIW